MQTQTQTSTCKYRPIPNNPIADISSDIQQCVVVRTLSMYS